MSPRILPFVALFATSACTMTPGQWALDGDATGAVAGFADARRASSWAADAERVFAGDAIFVDGRFASVPMLGMSGGFEGTLTDTEGRDVRISLPETTLTRVRTDGRVELYCAETDAARVEPAAGPGVCVGVRHERASGRLEWIVATLTGGTARVVATTPVADQTGTRFREGRRLTVDEQTLVTEIVFEGFDEGEIHFVRTIYQNRSANTETFEFDYPPRSGVPLYRIGDQSFEVMAVTPAQIEFRHRRL